MRETLSNKVCEFSETATFDIVEAGPRDPLAEVDERPLRLAAREDVVAARRSDDAMGSHGRSSKHDAFIGSVSSGGDRSEARQAAAVWPKLKARFADR